ncbi:MAG: type II toxin-antitoxin system VapC family toxin [Defluviitaleaceae bacterium]|nr:type II toxin-antitoxin system VapC family toxin [Defluviitaleaceae bacterium]
MKILLDTHILLWSAIDRLPCDAEKYILDESNTLYFSPASIWEIVIKQELGRPDFHVDPYGLYSGLLDNGYEELAIATSHVLSINTLPKIHKDPFDRILLAQAISESIYLLTSDTLLAKYSAPIIHIKRMHQL